MVLQPYSVPTTNHGTLWFLDENLPEMQAFRPYVRQRLYDELAASQTEGKCEALGKNPRGEDESIRFGVFTDRRPAHYPVFFGAYYLGRVFWRLAEARFMGAFPHVDTQLVGLLQREIIEGLMSSPFVDTEGNERRLSVLRCAVLEVQRDSKDQRTNATLAVVKKSRRLAVSATAIGQNYNEYSFTLA